MSTHDVAVIGAGMAGLTAAAYLVKSGKKVIVLDPAPEAGGGQAAFERAGFLFPAWPAITHGFETGGHYRALFTSLGLPVPGPAEARPYQVALPDRRVTVHPDVHATLEELRREYRREIDALARLLSETGRLAEQGARNRLAAVLARRRSAAEFLRSYRFSQELISFFDVQARFFRGTSLAGLSLAAFVEMVSSSPRAVSGGFPGLAAHLRHSIVRQGGECRFGEPWPEMRFKANRITILGTSQGAIEPRTVILNTCLDGSLQTLYFGIREEGIPVGMEESVLVLPDYQRSEDILSLSIASAEAGRVPAAGLKAVTASRLTSAGSGPANHVPLAGQVRSIMPFFEEFCVLSREEDFTARRFPLPSQVTVRPGRPGPEGRFLQKCTVRNLYIIPDAVPAGRTMEAAFKIAKTLS